MTKIEWCNKVWNIWVGCQHKTAGCDNCYAEVWAKRLKGMGINKYRNVVDKNGWTGKIKCDRNILELPLRWRKPAIIFVDSMGDFFYEDVPFDWMLKAYNTMLMAKRHTFIILTKRIDQTLKYYEWLFKNQIFQTDELPKNLWLGVSISTSYDLWMIEKLLTIPAGKRIVSVEPMLENIYLRNCPLSDSQKLFAVDTKSYRFDPLHPILVKYGKSIDLVICGCESGKNRRPAKIEWIRSLRDQCISAGVPFFLKQMEVCGKLVKIPELDGKRWEGWPE